MKDHKNSKNHDYGLNKSKVIQIIHQIITFARISKLRTSLTWGDLKVAVETLQNFWFRT